MAPLFRQMPKSPAGAIRQGFVVLRALTQASPAARTPPDWEALNWHYAPALDRLDVPERSLRPVPGGTSKLKDSGHHPVRPVSLSVTGLRFPPACGSMGPSRAAWVSMPAGWVSAFPTPAQKPGLGVIRTTSPHAAARQLGTFFRRATTWSRPASTALWRRVAANREWRSSKSATKQRRGRRSIQARTRPGEQHRS